MEEIEIWRNIEGYENYQVSSEGRVKNINYRNTGTEKILKTTLANNGYLMVNIYANNKGKVFLVHRLVANTFLPNPNNLNEINHKDECKTNNNVNNLEWCTHSYNNLYGTKNKRMLETKSQRGVIGAEKPIIQMTLDNQIIKIWPSIMEAYRNGFSTFHIWECCNGIKHKHKGFKWAYA